MALLLGSELPRIYTPPLRPLEPRSTTTEKRTLGYQCIDFATQDLGITLFPWQAWLLVHMLELTAAGRLRFRTVLVLVARQNGKSTLSVVLGLFFMYMLQRRLVIGTAQNLDIAEEIWQSAVHLVIEEDEEEDLLRPWLYEELENVVGASGKKALVLVRNRRWKVQAANRGAGRSLSADLVLLDELREHQTWDAWAALTKAMMARSFALTLGLSNAGDAKSVVLRYLRSTAHAALGNPDGLDLDSIVKPVLTEDLDDDEVDEAIAELEEQFEDDLAIFEWSAPPGMPTTDRSGWLMANPSTNHPDGIALRTIASAQRLDPEFVFRTEVLCQMSDSSLDGPFPEGAWEATLDETSTIADATDRVIGLDRSADRTFVHAAVAALNQRGVPHTELVASRAGDEWVVPWVQERHHTGQLRAVALQGKGAPVSALADALEAATCDDHPDGCGIVVHRWEGADLGVGTGAFFDAVRGALTAEVDHGRGVDHRKFVRLAQPLVDIAAGTAVPKILGDGLIVWNRTGSPTDIAPLVALNAALHALTNQPKPTRSAYEDSDLVIA